LPGVLFNKIQQKVKQEATLLVQGAYML